MSRRGRSGGATLAFVLVTFGLSSVAAPPAAAQRVGNPGSTFALTVQDGFLRIRNTVLSFSDEGRQPECSDGLNNDEGRDNAIDHPADTQCASADDDSELVGGAQVKQPVTMTGGTIAAGGTVTFPLSGVSFPPEYRFVEPSDSAEGFYSGFIVTVRITPLANVTGSVDPHTGAMTLHTRLRIDLDGGPLASDCRIEPIDINTHITGTTAPPVPNAPITGTPYNSNTGRAILVNNGFSVPGVQGCGTISFFVDLNDEMNVYFGLPSAAGNNASQLLAEFTPTRALPAITASFTATPSSGVAPLAVSFNANASTSVRPVASYQWDFTNNGSFDSSGVTSNFTYDTPGTRTVRLRVTDDQGDFAETTRTITALSKVFRPDALFKRTVEETYSGDGRYSEDGSNQLRIFDVKRGRSLVLDVAVQNDGNVADSFTLVGCGSSRGYNVAYFDGARDVTQEMVTGLVVPELAPTEIKSIRLTFKVTKRARRAKSCAITVSSDNDPNRVDAVVARVRPR